MMPSFWDRVGDAGDAVLLLSVAYVAVRLLLARQAQAKAANKTGTGAKRRALSDARIHLALATYQRQDLLYTILVGIAMKLVALFGRNFL